MSNDYYLINKKALPEYFEKVIEIKNLISRGMSVTDACKKCSLSRSTFYKYNKYVSLYDGEIDNYIYISISLYYEKNIILNLLNEIANNNIEIIKITQDSPINNIIYLSLTLKTDKDSILNIIYNFKNIKSFELSE